MIYENSHFDYYFHYNPTDFRNSLRNSIPALSF
jgi:hypothetical protein